MTQSVSMKIAGLIISFLLLTNFWLVGQDIDQSYENILLEEEESTEGLAFKPVIGVGVGSITFFGDVNDYFVSSINGLPAARISIGRTLGRYFDIEFHGTVGNVSGNQYAGDFDETLNFKTNLFVGGVSLGYNFNHWLDHKRPIHPYISLGVGIMQFSPKGDLKDANAVEYHYWTDGTIRDLEEVLGANGQIINRDYTYESDLRSLNESATYSKSTFSIPIDAGVNITVTDRVTCRVGAAFNYTGSDYVDNVKVGGNDMFLNAYVALTFDMFSAAQDIAAVENFKNLKFTITDNIDSDSDGVDDFNDECPDTPEGVKVTYKGCPEDTDKDGVPDYLDKQNDTETGAFAVGANGIKIRDLQLIALLYDADAVKRSEIKLYSENVEAKSAEASDGIPDKFKVVDVNNDRYISHEELQQAIDDIFEMNSTLTPGDIYELQEFFFNQ